MNAKNALAQVQQLQEALSDIIGMWQDGVNTLRDDIECFKEHRRELQASADQSLMGATLIESKLNVVAYNLYVRKHDEAKLHKHLAQALYIPDIPAYTDNVIHHTEYLGSATYLGGKSS
jgi:hypothetical protein